MEGLTELELLHWDLDLRVKETTQTLKEEVSDILGRTYWDKREADKATDRIRKLGASQERLLSWYYGDVVIENASPN